MNRIPFFLFCLFFPVFLTAQAFSPLQPDGLVNGTPLSNAFAGGLNSPQFNSIDINNDGVQDLCVFDRSGNVVLPFFWENEQWIHHPEFASVFPPVKEWMILRDYNGDGVQDLFAYSDVPGVDGIMVFEGFYQNNTIAFERKNVGNTFNVLFFELPSGGTTNLRVTKIDYPAIDDIDCDGDLDVLTFNVGGGQIELFQNMALERGFDRDTLMLKLVDFCWGGIFETGFTKEVELASTRGSCASPSSPQIDFRHAGSTILTIDMDDDGDKEAILGDLSFDNLNLLKNAGDCSKAWIDEQDVDFPSNTRPVDIFSYPASFWLDVDMDGVNDLLAAPNLIRGGEDLKVGWRYKNTGSNEMPVFEYRQDDFLVEHMFDLGSLTHPAFADVDGDGLLDLVVGNGGIFNDFEVTQSGLFLFKNTGSATEPRFELVDSNYLDMNQFNSAAFNFAPAFGDLDGDGDLDILVGEDAGGLFYAENTAGPNAPMTFGPWQYPYQDINVGLSGTPQIIDLNDDDLPDLVVGEKNGNINFFPNTGAREAPAFNPDPSAAPNNFFLGGVDTRMPGFIMGSSHPHFFYDDNELVLLTGTENSNLEVYRNIQDNLEGNFTFSEELSDFLSNGFKTAPAVADINNDGLLEMVLGNERGGLSFFSTPWRKQKVTSTENKATIGQIELFPNPARDKINIQLPPALSGQATEIRLINVQGQVLKSEVQEASPLIQMDLSGMTPGIYLIWIKARGAIFRKKILVGQ